MKKEVEQLIAATAKKTAEEVVRQQGSAARPNHYTFGIFKATAPKRIHATVLPSTQIKLGKGECLWCSPPCE